MNRYFDEINSITRNANSFIRFWINECNEVSYQPSSCQIRSLELQINDKKWLNTRDLATTAQWEQRCIQEWVEVCSWNPPGKGLDSYFQECEEASHDEDQDVFVCLFSRMPRIKHVAHFSKLIKNASVLYTYISCLLSNCGLTDTSEQFEFNRIFPSWTNF